MDTGASKVCWVGSAKSLREVTTNLISHDGVASGFGTGVQTNLEIYNANIGLRNNSNFITYRDVQITVANLISSGLYDVVLPNTLFNKFCVSFDWGCEDTLGMLRIDTHTNCCDYTVFTSNDGIISDIAADTSYESSVMAELVRDFGFEWTKEIVRSDIQNLARKLNDSVDSVINTYKQLLPDVYLQIYEGRVRDVVLAWYAYKINDNL